jgi:ubiquitin carboxyl-terminal hydrolase 1
VDPDAVRIKKEIEEAELDGFEEYVWEDADPETAPGTGRGWLRISDDSVNECGIESVLSEGSGVFMLYYEKAIISTASPQSHSQMTTMVSSVVGSNPYPEAAAAGYGARSYGVGGGYGVGSRTPLSSEETLKPEMTMTGMVNGNGHWLVLVLGMDMLMLAAALYWRGIRDLGHPVGV